MYFPKKDTIKIYINNVNLYVEFALANKFIYCRSHNIANMLDISDIMKIEATQDLVKQFVNLKMGYNEEIAKDLLYSISDIYYKMIYKI